MSTPALSVVTLTWNSERFVEPLLRTLLADAQSSCIDVEVLVVDNGSSDGTLRQLESFQKQHPSLHVIPLGRNLGTTRSRNIAIRMATAPLILVLDSDTELPPGTLRALLDAPTRIPDWSTVGIVAPRLVYPDGALQESARRFPTVLTKLYRLLNLEARRQLDETVTGVLQGELTQVDYAVSAAWLVPRSTFDRVGYLDEKIFYSPEDVDFCTRVWQAGLRVWYYPSAHVIHDCQRITRRKPVSRLALSHLLGLLRYWWRYGTFFVRLH